jgi:hypothetical protein
VIQLDGPVIQLDMAAWNAWNLARRRTDIVVKRFERNVLPPKARSIVEGNRPNLPFRIPSNEIRSRQARTSCGWLVSKSCNPYKVASEPRKIRRFPDRKSHYYYYSKAMASKHGALARPTRQSARNRGGGGERPGQEGGPCLRRRGPSPPRAQVHIWPPTGPHAVASIHRCAVRQGAINAEQYASMLSIDDAPGRAERGFSFICFHVAMRLHSA